ncbi:Monooxygenase [Cladobotryum mycophilum]|uniref:Monooxygenase n=1 Tax=Cladobotryum mycophilum TaxID=491253 RepID=A0ABR0SNG4_9HYPO
MAGRLFKSKIAPSSEPSSFFLTKNAARATSRLEKLFNKDTLNLQSTPLGGALFQLCLCILLPTQWAVVPPIAILLICILNSAIQSQASSKPAPNPDKDALRNVVFGRTTAQLPSAENGQLGPHPADKPVVVFNLGVQFNHPLGPRCPGAREINEYFTAMNADLQRRREDLGLLGLSSWRGAESDAAAGTTVLSTYFFRDEASVHRFAHEALHRRAWDFYGAAKPKHIGVFHETFVVPARMYETMYVNCSPTMMGRGVVKCETENEEGRGSG